MEDPNEAIVDLVGILQQCMHLKVLERASRIEIIVSMVNDLYTHDYNAMFEFSHCCRGVEIIPSEIQDGVNRMRGLNLSFLRSDGHFYSWLKGLVSGRILTRIDHVIVNGA